MAITARQNIVALRWHYGEIREVKFDNGDLKDISEVIDMASKGEINEIPSNCSSTSSFYNHIQKLKNLIEL